MKIRLALLILTIAMGCVSKQLQGQFSLAKQKQIDSLNAIINLKTTHDTSLTNAYVSLAEILYIQHPDTVFYLCREAERIIQKALLNNPPPIVKKKLLGIKLSVVGNLGYAYKTKGEINTALKFYNNCLELCKEQGDTFGLASMYNNLGVIYKNYGDIPTSLENYHKSLSLYEKTGEKKGMAYLYNNIGHIQEGQENYDNAIEFYQKGLHALEDIGDEVGISTIYNNIGKVYEMKRDIPRALEFYDKSIKIGEAIGFNKGLHLTYGNIGKIHKESGNISLALGFLELSLTAAKASTFKEGVSSACFGIGDLMLHEGRLDEATKMATKGLKLAAELGNPEQIEVNAGLMCRIAMKKGDYKNALKMRNLQIKMRDSLININTQKAAIHQRVKYKFEKQLAVQKEKAALQTVLDEAVIEKREAERNVAMVISFFLFVISIAGFIVNRFKTRAAEKQLRLKIDVQLRELELLRAYKSEERPSSLAESFKINKEDLNNYLQNPLSERELEVLYLMADGNSNKEISEKIFVAVNTVKTHIKRIYTKLEVNNRTQAVKRAGTLDILSGNEPAAKKE